MVLCCWNLVVIPLQLYSYSRRYSFPYAILEYLDGFQFFDLGKDIDRS